MEPSLGSSLKLCGFCSQLTDEVETLTPGIISFLQSLLRIPAVRLPTKLCPDCLKRASNAKKFQEKCLRAFEKLEQNGISGEMVWGREASCLDSGGGLEYSRRLHGPLKFPLITITASDRAMAEAHIQSSGGRWERQVMAKKEYEELSDDNWDSAVSSEASLVQSDDDEEIFPAVGPFQCEICREVSATKQMFVEHIKARHRFSIDPEVLSSLELDLKKREEKIQKTAIAARIRPRKKRRTISVKEEVDPAGEKYGREKRKYKHRQKLLYVDLAGNILPKAAGKYPGVCGVCGKTIGRGNGMFSHQQTEACLATRRSGPAEKDAGEALVVLVTNYQGHSSADQPALSEPELSLEEEKEEKEEGDERKEEEEPEPEPDEKDRALAETLRSVVRGWLEEQNDVNYNKTVISGTDKQISTQPACVL